MFRPPRSTLLVIGLWAAVSVTPTQALDPRAVAMNPALREADVDQPSPAQVERVLLREGFSLQRDATTGLVRSVSGGRTAPLGRTAVEAARAALNTRTVGLMRKAQSDQLVLRSTSTSPAGHHVTFQQEVSGVPVLGGQVRVHLDRAMGMRMLTSGARPVPVGGLPVPSLDEARAIEAATRELGVLALRAPARARLHARVADGEMAPVYVVELPSLTPLGDFQVVVDGRGGRIVSRKNRMVHAEPTAKVFDPNPCVALQDSTLKDSGTIPEAAYATVTLLGLDESGMLRGAFADLSQTTGGPALEPTGAFHYDRLDPRFEQAMVYAHIDRAQRYIQELGFTNILNRPQVADAHGTSDDNSWFSPMTKRLTFGDGGVNDAQDADVIMHEYGHAIQDDQVPDFGETNEGGSMGEGFGDYWAASLRRGDPAFHPAAVAMWDATAYSNASPPALRRLDSTKHYPEAIEGEVHADGEIWSASLRQIWDRVGGRDADKLVLQSHFFLNSQATFADGAAALLQADQQLFMGAHEGVIRDVFTARGIPLPPVVPPTPPAPAPILRAGL